MDHHEVTRQQPVMFKVILDGLHQPLSLLLRSCESPELDEVVST